MDDDWDLHAVVRGCCTTPTATPTALARNLSSSPDVHHHHYGAFPSSTATPFFGPAVKKDVELPDLFGELHEFYRPFFSPKSEPFLLHNAAPPHPHPHPAPAFERASNGRLPLNLKRPHLSLSPTLVTSSGSISGAASQASRSKRSRKNQFKKVCQVPAECLSSDIWAWRKYGQKPIKGSPYPRGYYRCSSSKGCLARKQVERNRSDPGMFIVTYTAEHNHPAPAHRNSLAGSTRQKPATSGEPSPVSGEPSYTATSIHLPPPYSASPATSPEDEAVRPPQSTSIEAEYDEDGEVGVSDTAPNDDFFEGLEGLIDEYGKGGILDRFPGNFGLSWTVTAAAAAASSGT